jgi:hypothetical protein
LNIDQDLEKGKMMRKREGKGKKKRKEKGKKKGARANTTYPPTHVVICIKTKKKQAFLYNFMLCKLSNNYSKMNASA